VSAKEPGERFASAGELAEELRRWLNDEPLRIRPPRWWETVWRWARRNRLTAASLAAALLLLVAGSTLGGMAWVQYQRATEALGLRAEVEARTLLMQAQQRLRLPTQGRRTETLELLRRLAGARQKVRDEEVRERLQLDARSVLAEALGEPDLAVEDSTSLPHYVFANWRVALHPSGKRLAVGTHLGPLPWVRGERFQHPPDLDRGKERPRLSYSPDGKYLLFAPAAGGLELYDEGLTRRLANRASSALATVLAFGFDAAGETVWVCCGDGQVHSLSLPDLKATGGWKVAAPSGRITAAFNRDATVLAVGNKDGEVSLHENGRFLRSLPPGRIEVEALAWSPDGELVAVGTQDGNVQLWPKAEGPPSYPFTLGDTGVSSIVFSPDGRWALAGSCEGMRMWDVATGEQVLTGGYPPSPGARSSAVRWRTATTP
jgi:hypothetical protein